MKKMKPFFRAALRDSGVYELLIYEEIGSNWWTGEGVTVKDLKASLDSAGQFSRIAMRINSPGGDVFEGVAILNMLRAQGKPVDVFVDGLAASAASIIAMAGDTITMGSGAMMMIHNAWGGCIGNAAEMEKMLASLTAIDASIVQIYAGRTGMKPKEAKALMDAETWMTAADCISNGFATALAPEANQEALAMARSFKALSRFAKVPEKFKAGVACTCDCAGCQEDNCAGCVNADCQDLNCSDCPMQTVANAAYQAVAPIQRLGENIRAMAEIAFAHGGPGWRDAQFPASPDKFLALRSARANLVASGNERKVICVVAPYNQLSCDLGGFKEIYEPGCFTESLASREDFLVLAHHDPRTIIGCQSAGTAEFYETSEGLCFKATAPDTQWARDLATSMQRGDIKNGSAAFYILKSRWAYDDAQKIRVIEKAALVEGSICAFAAYSSSTAVVEEQEQTIAAEHHKLRLRLLKAS